MNTSQTNISMLSAIFGAKGRAATHARESIMRKKELADLREMTQDLEIEQRKVRQDLVTFDGFFSGVSLGLAMVTLEYTYYKVNIPYARLLNAKPDELVGVRVDSRWPPAEPNILELLKRAEAEGFVDLTLLNIKQDVAPRYLVISVKHIVNDGYGIVLEDQGRICERMGCPNRMLPNGR